MKYLVIFAAFIFLTGTTTQQSLGSELKLFDGTSSFERVPDTITPGITYEFEIKFRYTESPFWLHDIFPVIEVAPEGAAQNVHIDFNRTSAQPGAIDRIPVTINVDPDIPYEKIFLSVAFVAENSSGDELRSSWSDSLPLDIDRQQKNPCFDEILNQHAPCDDSYEILILDLHQAQIENIDGQLFRVTGPFTLQAQSNDTIRLGNVEFSYPYFPIPTPPGGVQSVRISFQDGMKESIGTVGPPNPFLEFTEHENPKAGVRRNSDGTFDYLLSITNQSISPLKQFTLGIPIDQIQCKEGLELILKSSGDSPSCVSPETKQKLIEIGWAKSPRSISEEFSRVLDGESKGSFDVHGSVDGARLSGISFDEHLNQLTIELEESQDGQLTITVPRELFKTDLGNDPDFMVIIDKEESTYSENKANTDSTLSISFPTKTKEIWIIGTYPVSYHALPDDAVLQVTADAPCAWMTLQQLPHSELLKQHDRTGRNALMLKINDDHIGKVPHLKEMITALQSESGFEPYEYDENTWQKRITSTESEQQQIWDWLKETSDSQFGQLSDHSFTTYFTYQGKYYHIIWALC